MVILARISFLVNRKVAPPIGNAPTCLPLQGKPKLLACRREIGGDAMVLPVFHLSPSRQNWFCWENYAHPRKLVVPSGIAPESHRLEGGTLSI